MPAQKRVAHGCVVADGVRGDAPEGEMRPGMVDLIHKDLPETFARNAGAVTAQMGEQSLLRVEDYVKIALQENHAVAFFGREMGQEGATIFTVLPRACRNHEASRASRLMLSASSK
jgi:hypothetical protein